MKQRTSLAKALPLRTKDLFAKYTTSVERPCLNSSVFGKRLAAVVRSKHSEAGTVIAAIKSEANRNATKAKRPKAERTVRPTTAKHTRTTAT